MVNSEPPPRRPPSTEGGSEARDVSNPVMANITKYQHIFSITKNKERKDQQRKVSQRKGQIEKMNMEVWEDHQLMVDYNMKTMNQPNLEMTEHFVGSIH